jgi:hypothetical protein
MARDMHAVTGTTVTGTEGAAMTMNVDALDLTQFTLIDGRGQRVGQVEYVWNAHDSDQPEFVGVHAGLLGRTHLVPLRLATIDPATKTITVSYFNDTIRNTRHFAPGYHLTSQDRWELYNEYGQQPPEPGAPTPYHADLQESGAEEAGVSDELDTPTNAL